MMRMNKNIRIFLSKPRVTAWIYGLLGAVYIFLVAEFTIPAVRDLFMRSVIFLLPMALFTLLGTALLLSKRKRNGRSKWVSAVAISSIAPFLSVILHNLFYGIRISVDPELLKSIFGAAEVTFFLIAIPVAPIVFIISYVMGFRSMFAARISKSQTQKR